MGIEIATILTFAKVAAAVATTVAAVSTISQTKSATKRAKGIEEQRRREKSESVKRQEKALDIQREALAPPIITETPVVKPSEAVAEAEEIAAADVQKVQRQRRRARTIATTPRGLLQRAAVTRKTLLGD